MSAVPTLIGVPSDAGSTFRRGASLAPPLIRAAFHSPAGNSWTEHLADLSVPGAFDDAGDLDLPPGAPHHPIIAARIAEISAAGRRPVVLGGDHAITWPVLEALRPYHAKLSILHFDAHPDLYDEFEDRSDSHASPFARIMERGLADQLVQVGIRAGTGHQAVQAARFGVEVIRMTDWVAGRRPVLQHPVYISLDLDALDPAFAPGVSHREPGGLSVRDVITVFENIPVPVVGADLVEFNPLADLGGLTAVAAAKLLREVIATMLLSY